MWLWGIGLFIMPETKGGNTEQLKQQSFLLPQRLSSKEVMMKEAPGAGGALRCLKEEGEEEGNEDRKAQVIQTCRAGGDVSTLCRSGGWA